MHFPRSVKNTHFCDEGEGGKNARTEILNINFYYLFIITTAETRGKWWWWNGCVCVCCVRLTTAVTCSIFYSNFFSVVSFAFFLCTLNSDRLVEFESCARKQFYACAKFPFSMRPFSHRLLLLLYVCLLRVEALKPTIIIFRRQRRCCCCCCRWYAFPVPPCPLCGNIYHRTKRKRRVKESSSSECYSSQSQLVCLCF